MAIEDTSTSRGRFLRGLGVTAAAAIGAVVLPGKAKAMVNQCCPSNLQQCPECSGYQYMKYCDCYPFGPSYCLCYHSDPGGCTTAAC
jgi:hypothetical protein